MPCYTCLTENRGRSHLSQHNVNDPECALREHIAALPFFVGINPIGDELYWLQTIALGKREVTLRPLVKCTQVWKWHEGEHYSPRYTTYVVKTNTR